MCPITPVSFLCAVICHLAALVTAGMALSGRGDFRIGIGVVIGAIAVAIIENVVLSIWIVVYNYFYSKKQLLSEKKEHDAERMQELKAEVKDDVKFQAERSVMAIGIVLILSFVLLVALILEGIEELKLRKMPSNASS